MTELSPPLTMADREALALLAEECAEVIQAVGKLLRHGVMTLDEPSGTKYDNRAMLSRELGHVTIALALLPPTVYDDKISLESAIRKSERIQPYLHHLKVT